MLNSLLLGCLGLLLIFLEFFLPGAILGVLGGLVLLASIVNFSWHSTAIWQIAAYLVFIAMALFYLIKYALWRIRTKGAKRGLYLSSDQEGYVASHYDASLIGKKAVAATDLKPGGYITVEGQRLQALAESGYIVKGSHLLIIRGQEESLVVRELTTL